MNWESVILVSVSALMVGLLLILVGIGEDS